MHSGCRSSRARRRRFPARPTGNGCRPTGRASIAASARNTAGAACAHGARGRGRAARRFHAWLAAQRQPAPHPAPMRNGAAGASSRRAARVATRCSAPTRRATRARSHARRVAPAARGRHARQHPDNLRRWIAHAQQIKPDALMPSIALARARRRRSRRVSRDPALNGGCRWPSPATCPPRPCAGSRRRAARLGARARARRAVGIGARLARLARHGRPQAHRAALHRHRVRVPAARRRRGARDAHPARAAERDPADARAIRRAVHDARRHDDLPVRAARAVRFRELPGR